MIEYVRIPSERIQLIHAEGKKLLKFIESHTKTKISIDEENCEVIIKEAKDFNDTFAMWKARDIVKAIGRGFEPEIALKLLNNDFELRVIDLKEFFGKKQNDAIRIKGRIIGKNGKAKRDIEGLTDTSLSVYGKTVAIIGASDKIHLAAKAVIMLASGAMHWTVYKMIAKELGR